MKKTALTYSLACSLVASAAVADDIDIYVNSANTGSAPYVSLMLDYRPDVFATLCTYGPGGTCAPPFMSPDAYAELDPATYSAGDPVTKFAAFTAVLSALLNRQDFQDIYLSLLVPNKSNGGSVLLGYSRVRDRRNDILATLASIPQTASTADAHPLQPKETYFEWFRYLSGGNVVLGTNTGGNFAAPSGQTPVPDYDPGIIQGSAYTPPPTGPQDCPKLFSIALATDLPSMDSDLDSEIAAEMSPSAATSFENMLQYLHADTTDLASGLDGEQALEKTWIISDTANQAAFSGWARAGGSGLVLNLDQPAQLEQQLLGAFTEVVSVSSTFVAPAVPVNVFNRVDALDNLYYALFEARPTIRWNGNIKKLRLVDTTGDGRFDDIQDVNGAPGLESTGENRGRIAFDALTYWTDAGALPPGNGQSLPVNADGRVVARGGAGQKITGFIVNGTESVGDANGTNTRQVYVEPAITTNGSNTVLDDFDVTDTLADQLIVPLGAADRAESRSLIAWGRGQDVNDEDGDGDVAEARQWIFGDAMHSQPLALNYGAYGGYSETNPLIRLFVGTNDGVLRVIENTEAAGGESGREIAAIYPRETLGNLKFLRDDTQASSRMRYGVDGSPAVWVRDRQNDGTLDHRDGDRAFVYFGLRRGGRNYYALDVSNPDSAPRLRWKIEQTNNGDFDELGLTFSKPIVGRVRYRSGATDVVIFAGGYNGGWDATYTNRVGKDSSDGDDAEGNAIYIVDANTGALIWKAVQGTTGNSSDTHYEHAGLVDSIPSTITAMRGPNGVIHRLYVGDTGGAVWRVDLPEGQGAGHRQNRWFVTKLAELGTDGTNSDRRFFHEPDIVETFDDNGDFDGVLISSGDRAHPLERNVINYHFYIKDRLITSGDPAVRTRAPLTIANTDLFDQTACVRGTEGVGICGSNTELLNGWKIAMNRPGEKGLSTPLVVAGRVFFTSYVPPAATPSCAPSEGESAAYVVNLADGTAEPNQLRIYNIGPGMASGAVVIGDAVLIPGSGLKLSDLDGDGDLDMQKLVPGLSRDIFPLYWRESGVDDL